MVTLHVTDSESENVAHMNQRFFWVGTTESENAYKIKVERDIWVYQKWDGFIVCAMTGVGEIGLVDGQFGGGDSSTKKKIFLEVMHKLKGSQSFIKKGKGRRAP